MALPVLVLPLKLVSLHTLLLQQLGLSLDRSRIEWTILLLSYTVRLFYGILLLLFLHTILVLLNTVGFLIALIIVVGMESDSMFPLYTLFKSSTTWIFRPIQISIPHYFHKSISIHHTTT